ncbi:MAG: S41 family peptidase [Candidatus Limnocylindrales bacterium]
MPDRRVSSFTALLAAVLLTIGFGVTQQSPVSRVAAADPSASPETTNPDSAPADFELFWEALGVVREHFVDDEALRDENLTRGAIRGMVEALGDTGHTVYLTPDEVQSEIDALDGRVIGIGVSIDTRGGVPVVIAVFPGSPADEAGLRVGDVIESVDGRRVDRLGVEQLIERVRGEPGTRVVLGVERGDGSHDELPIVRAEVIIPPVAWSMVPGTTIADVGINQFSDGAGRETRRAVRRALADGATGIVLDLRGNPGGLVHEAMTVAGLFLPTGSIVYREEDRGGERSAVTTDDEPVAPDVPLVVLVDGGSASAAEIVASALHDNGRARIVGERTYGTGTVLNLFPLSDGSAIRLGVLLWLTPGGVGVFETGVAPDVAVELGEQGTLVPPDALDGLDTRGFRRAGDAQLRRAVRLLTSDPAGTPGPAATPAAARARDDAAPTPSTRPAEAPPSPLEASS